MFIGLVQLLSGPSTGDADQTGLAAWTIAHGSLSCSFVQGNNLVAPLYPLVAAGAVAALGIGRGATFPGLHALGPHCANVATAVTAWSVRADAATATSRIGYVAWLVMAAGVVSILRACGRGRCALEPLCLALAACSPCVFMCLQEYFHPQDLLAVGLSLCGVASAMRARWVLAGIAFGFALVTQQLALLAFIPVVVLAARWDRVRLVAAAIGAWTVVVIPLVGPTAHGVVRAATVGSADTTGIGRTVLAEAHLGGAVQLACVRIAPIAASIAVAWWARRRLHASITDTTTVLSLVAISLALRLVFEKSLFGYYFMGLAVLLVVLAVVRRRDRLCIAAWVAGVAIAFPPFPHGNHLLPEVLPVWCWQLLLVPFGLVLAASPLAAARAAPSASCDVQPAAIEGAPAGSGRA